MIRLTHESGKQIYVNPETIVDIFPVDNGGSKLIAQLIFVTGEGYRVTESPEEVVRKIMEYKLALVQYRSYLDDALCGGDWGKTFARQRELTKLAGLEDNQDG